VAVDANGNAIAVWRQKSGTYYSIYANRYNAGVGVWSGAVLIAADDNNAYSPQVAVDPDGNAIAVWQQRLGTHNRIYANRWDAGASAWSGAVIIDAGDNNAGNPQVAVDANGNAFAVWMQFDGTYNNIYANRYDTLSGAWSGAVYIDIYSYDSEYPQVAVDANGNAIAVWEQYNGTYSWIRAIRYDALSGTWFGTEIINARYYGTHANISEFPQVAVNANGSAIAVWQQYDGTYKSIFANRWE
jgi:predicted enzyme related to lactoylglutathione lyase